VVGGIWFENRAAASNPALRDALAAGMARFMRFVGAASLDAGAVEDRKLRTLLNSVSRSHRN
jgi:hypothetical protein